MIRPVLAALVLAAGACRRPAPAPVAAPEAPAPMACATTAPGLVRALRDAADRRDWAAWRAQLSRAQADRYAGATDPGVQQQILSAWSADLALVDPATTTVEDDGLTAWVMAPEGADRAAVLKLAREDGCLRVDEN